MPENERKLPWEAKLLFSLLAFVIAGCSESVEEATVNSEEKPNALVKKQQVKNGMSEIKSGEELLSQIIAVAVVRDSDDEAIQIIAEDLKSHGIDSWTECLIVCETSVLKKDAEKARDIIRKSKRLRGKWVKIREENGEWVSSSDSHSPE